MFLNTSKQCNIVGLKLMNDSNLSTLTIFVINYITFEPAEKNLFLLFKEQCFGK